MRKIVIAAGIGAASLALAACGQPGSEDDSYADSEAVAEEATADEAAADDTAMEGEAAAGDEAPEIEGMDDGDRANGTGRNE